MKLLIEASNKTDINSKDVKEFTPLHYAVERGREDIVELLIEQHADVNVKNKRKQTPLDLAAAFQFEYISKILLQNKADLNSLSNDKEVCAWIGTYPI